MSDSKGNRDWIAIAGIVVPLVVAMFLFGTSMNTRMAVMENELKHLQAEIEGIKPALRGND